jgi:hypothetical protein
MNYAKETELPPELVVLAFLLLVCQDGGRID